ncbi:AfsR/SARP family transcriptional regulator [Streptomyces sp. ME19-01-6]|uniref:AfsR/SARP family transcriptional regulator n=1 Tax=Streptomyces sp. ME19-01-6 TaxID=3028686 RepID=UPI0029A2081E|nr:tetratricopeptide repeat protein [Streptomyces sp. ME19-01-6]MDX3227960.1 tetratricopeptide repeat protein [Streptomyces sp. ME19-01-6]
MKLRILLLGAVELWAGERRSPLGTPKERLTLAALAWDAGRTVSVDTLVHRIWDDRPPTKPRDALYVHISRIRKAFSALAGSQAPAVISRAHTYRLQADPDAVDLRRYLSLLDQGRWLADSGSIREARQALQEANRLWGGEPLAGLPGDWAGHLRNMVEEKNLATALLQADISLRSGNCAEAVANLQPVAERGQTDESVIGRLALALHSCGRTEAATRLLQRTRHLLVRESGIEPGEAFQRIHRGILAREPVAALLSPTTASNGLTFEPVPDSLPPDVIWVGRQAELDRLTSAWTDRAQDHEACVTATAVTGMPGSGKTALAVHAAHQMRDQFPHGRLFLNLRGHALLQPPMTSAEALGELLRLLGTPTEALPQDLNGLVALWRSTTRGRRFVAVLDDAAGTEQVTPLLPGDSSSLIIVTSRRQLDGLTGIRQIALDVLSRADAIALLQRLLGDERAPSAEEAATLARLCGYLPLALAITARRLLSRPTWGVSDLVERFNRAARRLPEIRDRHHAMAQAFEVSYRELTPTQQTAFRRLGLHVGVEFGPGAVAALTDLPLEETELILEEFLACHLISEPAPHRYRLHDLLREYASTLAGSDPGTDNQRALTRLLDHYLYTADQADRGAYPHRLRIALPQSSAEQAWHDADPQQWFIAEGPNLLVALDYTRTHGSPRRLALTTHVLAGFLTGEGYLRSATPLLYNAVGHWQNTGLSKAHGRALIDLSSACAGAGTYDESIQSAQTALELAQETADEHLEAEALHQLSISHWHTARHTEAFGLQQRALQLRLKKADRLQQGRSFNLLGMICLSLERHKDALKYFLEGLARFRDVGDRRGQFIALNNLAELHKEAGNLDHAISSYQQSIKLSQALGSRGQYAILQMNLADTLRAHGRPQEALELYAKALPELRSIDDRRSEAIAHNGAGRALHEVGRSEQALPHHTAALAIARTINAALEECQALRALAEAEHATGRLSQARAHLEAGLAVSRKIKARSEEADILRSLALFQPDLSWQIS